MNNLEIENERLKLTIKQLECRIDLLNNKDSKEIDHYKEIIKIRDDYIKLLETSIESHYYELEKRIDSLCFMIGGSDDKHSN